LPELVPAWRAIADKKRQRHTLPASRIGLPYGRLAQHDSSFTALRSSRLYSLKSRVWVLRPATSKNTSQLENLVISVPHSIMTVCAGEMPKPSTRLMSTPLILFLKIYEFFQYCTVHSYCMSSACAMKGVGVRLRPSLDGSLHTCV
jgi:hypothetical protein